MPGDFESVARSLRDAGSISQNQFKELLRARTQRSPFSDIGYSLGPVPELLEEWRKAGTISGYDYNRLFDALKPPSKESIRTTKEKMKARFRRIDAKYSKGTPVVQGGLPGQGKRR
jgi:hypothetical protein